ncbi:LysR family transcriptional regulator [Variovorax soli]|uniref:LysR family transcriptional regulator n=1 Tax=Variovorax soli TaxID=376815 RepID=UPI0009FC0E4C|nr:LysR family transcriptional regulator [Variovorax soli]
MNPKHLTQLAMVLEKGSITEAAKSLAVTQPTLTRNMATLEMQAGAPLFTRSRFGVRSTPLGEALAREGRAIATRVQQAGESIAQHRLGLFNRLRVGVGPLLGLALMPRLAPAFLDAFPHVALTITTGRPTALVEELVDGQHDVVIAPALSRELPADISRTLLLQDTIGVFCGALHPLAIQPSSPALDACEWINVGVTSPFQNDELDYLRRNGIRRPKTQLATIADAAILLQVLRQGRHLAVLPRLPVAMIDTAGELRQIALPCEPAPRDVLAWTRTSVVEQPAVQGLLHLARELMLPPAG